MKHSTPPPVKGQDVGYGGKRSKANYVKNHRTVVNWIITTVWPTQGWNPSFQVEVGVSLDILEPWTPPYLGLGI